MIRIGLLGVGHLGKIHLKLLTSIPEFDVVGFYDADPEVAAVVSEEFGVKAFADSDSLFEEVDALDIVTPTVSHFKYARQALLAGKHMFIEKPLTHTIKEGEELLHIYNDWEKEQGSLAPVVQVGHVERFNPAYLSIEDKTVSPKFIEGHRLAKYNPRGTDVSVVLDLMIHDIDVVLSVVKSEVTQISASGVAVVSDTPDIANARIEFENGCVANLTASRISVKNMRRLRMFQKNSYLAIDFLAKKAEVFSISDAPVGMMSLEIDTGKDKKYLVYELPEVKEVNAIKMELEEFASSMMHRTSVRVPLEDGFNALSVAHQVLNKIEESVSRVLEKELGQ